MDRGGPLKILVIDDDEEDYIIIRDMFSDIKGQKYAVDWMAEYGPALGAVKENRHDVFLVDYRLGPRSGLDLVREAVGNGCRAPIILLTGQGDHDIDLQAMKVGAADYLVKGEMNALFLERSVRYAVEHKKMESALQESHRGLEQKIDAKTRELRKSLKDLEDQKYALDISAIVVITDISGKITYVNDHFCKISQYSREELIGQDHRMINSGHHSKAFMKDLWDTIINGKVWKGEIKNRAKDGSFYWLDTTIIPFLNEEGIPYQYVAVRTDITKRKVIEADLERALLKAIDLNEKAQQATRAKSSFLANMSHEIRTPMNAILGFGELLEKTPLNERQKKYLVSIQSGGQLLVKIIDDVLDFSRLESGRVKLESIPFDLEYMIYDVFKMTVARMKDRPIDTYVDIDQDVPLHVEGDPVRIKQILVNLLGNAIKFTVKGSIGVIVQLRSKEAPPAADGTMELLLKVKDTGTGILNKKLDAIFEMFTQEDESTTRKFGGTGLGLSISKSIVELMGGKIWVESQVGKGSEFIFTLKLKRRYPVGPQAKPLPDIRPIRGMKTFIIDDNQILRRMIHRYCQRMDLKILGTADSSRSALQQIDGFRGQKSLIPDLILCDIIMEEMDGFQLVERLRELPEFKDVKYIAVTADMLAETSDQAAKGLFDAYITKPVSLREMVGVIRKVMGVWEKKAEEPAEESKALADCGGIKVLVVEDSPLNQDLMRAYFGELKCEGDFVSNGEEAIAKLKTNEYHVCLMDLNMPVMGGAEATRIIRREISRGIPIIALSAAVLENDRKESQEAGMNDFLAKPIDLAEMAEKISQYGKNG